jgi:hypothetical protein
VERRWTPRWRTSPSSSSGGPSWARTPRWSSGRPSSRPRSEARRELASGEKTGVLLLLRTTAAGLIWAALEDTSGGPRGWDLACLRTTARLDGRAPIDALPEPMSDEELAPFLWLRRLHAAAWWFV